MSSYPNTAKNVPQMSSKHIQEELKEVQNERIFPECSPAITKLLSSPGKA